MTTIQDVKYQAKNCISEIIFNSLRGRLSVPRQPNRTSFYHILLKFPYVLELSATGQDTAVAASLKIDGAVVGRTVLDLPEEIDKMRYEDFIDLVVTNICRDAPMTWDKAMSIFTIDKKEIKIKLAERIGEIISEAEFRAFGGKPKYYDPQEFMPNRMYSTYTVKYTNRNTEHHVSFLYYKAGERDMSPYPQFRINLEIEEERSSLTYKAFLEKLAEEAVSEMERELFNLYWVLGIPRTEEKTNTSEDDDEFGGSGQF